MPREPRKSPLPVARPQPGLARGAHWRALLLGSLTVPVALQRRVLRRVLPVTSDYAGGRFLTRVGGKIMVTPLFVALVAIETTDLVFALYFLLAGSMDRFRYLKQGLAVLLVFIGAKMLLSPVIHIPVMTSLGVIILMVGSAVAASLWRDRALAKRDGLVPD
jgi:predicted tellurium resistance membrane protein TerC